VLMVGALTVELPRHGTAPPPIVMIELGGISRGGCANGGACTIATS